MHIDVGLLWLPMPHAICYIDTIRWTLDRHLPERRREQQRLRPLLVVCLSMSYPHSFPVIFMLSTARQALRTTLYLVREERERVLQQVRSTTPTGDCLARVVMLPHVIFSCIRFIWALVLSAVNASFNTSSREYPVSPLDDLVWDLTKGRGGMTFSHHFMQAE